MHLNLSPQLEQLSHRKIETGRYGTPSEVQHDTGLRANFAAAGVSLRAGQTVDGDAVLDRLEAELEVRRHIA